jgi:threonine dehydratase
MLSRARIEEAAAFLQPRLRQTPVELSPALSARAAVPVWLKLESLQLTGSFKIRGAWFRLHRASREERRAGVVTCSAGNHGKAIAYAARAEGIRAVIFVPATVDEAKLRGMQALGADVRRLAFPGFDETQAAALDAAQRDGMPFISAFDDYDVMAGNGGSLALETAQQLPDARSYFLPVGGGGLAAGFAVGVEAPGVRLLGCQHEQSPALRLSLDRGSAVTTLPFVETLAAGVEGGIGELTFAELRTRVHDVVLVSEAEIRSAVKWMVREHQYLIEPTAAVTVAALLSGRFPPLPGAAVVMVCGRNVDSRVAAQLLA